VPLKSTIRRVVPTRLRSEVFRLRRLGPRKFLEYTRLEQQERRRSTLDAGAPFDVGGRLPIVVPPTAVHAVRSHWVDYGHGIKELRAFARLAPQHESFLDIGAAEGIFSAAFCAFTHRAAWAFEPSPEMQERLADMCRVNPDFEISYLPFALGARERQQALWQYSDGQFGALPDGVTGTQEMEVRTLDAVVQDQGISADLAKIDVEGMELEVLRGGASTFAESVRSLLLEVHWELLEERGESAAELEGLLRELGFVLFTLDFEPIGDLTAYAEREPEMVPGYTIIVCQKSSPA
jgi:FkbM family methyltransferase